LDDRTDSRTSHLPAFENDEGVYVLAQATAHTIDHHLLRQPRFDVALAVFLGGDLNRA
jgi:hypothetical protein